MDWVLSTFDRFLAAIFVAVVAVAASQAEPFATQYSARTAAQLSQSQAHLKDAQTGVRYQVMAPNVRSEIEGQAKATLAARQATHTAVTETMPLLRPFALWRNGDDALMAETWRNFVPALPLTITSAINAFIGCVLGFALYELLKLPIVVIARTPRRRFKKRG